MQAVLPVLRMFQIMKRWLCIITGVGVLLNKKHVRMHAAKPAFWNVAPGLSGWGKSLTLQTSLWPCHAIQHRYQSLIMPPLAPSGIWIHDGVFCGCKSLIVSLTIQPCDQSMQACPRTFMSSSEFVQRGRPRHLPSDASQDRALNKK